MSFSLSRAGQWWLHSGIQGPSGGVARYYRSDLEKNHPVSTEITGYAASALVYLHSLTHEPEFLKGAAAAARFLCVSLDTATGTLPFETEPAEYTYFFDCGIVVRGLLSAWRATGTDAFRETARTIGCSMARDFVAADGSYHPILALPGKTPTERDAMRWSRSAACYQLKSAMAWFDLAEATGEASFRDHYRKAVLSALRDYRSFLPGHPDPVKVMDRLHAFSYFLEGMLPCSAEPDCAAALKDGISRLAALLREIAPRFERSDVYAQLLRIRIYAERAGVAPLDMAAAKWEAERLAGFQAASPDARIDGGFYFGRRPDGWLPYVNPVSTAFALQALALWDAIKTDNSRIQPHRHLLI